MTAAVLDVLAVAQDLHARETHPDTFFGPCYGPTPHDVRRADRLVSLRRHELLEKVRVERRGWHWHRCVRPSCRRRYQCGHACDPHHLSDSLCDMCFDDVRK